MMPTNAPVPNPFPSLSAVLLVDDDEDAVLSRDTDDVGVTTVTPFEDNDDEGSVGAALMDGCVDNEWRGGNDDADPKRLERLTSVKLPVKLALGRIYVDPSFTGGGGGRKRLCVNISFL